MLLKKLSFLRRNTMGKTVTWADTGGPRSSTQLPPAPSLYAPGNNAGRGRKYLNHDERFRVLEATSVLDVRHALFALTLAWTGARVSEVLALTPSSFQIEQSVVSLVTLKRRRWSVREVPIPPHLMQALEQEFALCSARQDADLSSVPIWSMCRVTAWRVVKRVMSKAGIVGRAACPRGMRHGFGVGTLQAGVPITLVQRWLGHARLSTTAIYAEVSGPEEIDFAGRFWNS
jgi:integrase